MVPSNLRTLGVLITALSLALSNFAIAKARNYPRFPAWKDGNWRVIDDGKQRCDATYSIGDFVALEIWGPFYFRPDDLSSGTVWHYQGGKESYSLPEGYIAADFPVELVAGEARILGSGVANIKDGWMAVDSLENGTTIDLLNALPDNAKLIAQGNNKPVYYTLALNGNVAAAKALAECTGFIETQKRPGTKNGPAWVPPDITPPWIK